MGDDVNASALIGTVLYGSALETGNQLFDNSFLSGFSALFSGYNDAAGIASNIAENIAENQASRLTPSAIRALAKVTDPYVRDVYSQNAVKQFLNRQIVQNWPLCGRRCRSRRTSRATRRCKTAITTGGQENQNSGAAFPQRFCDPVDDAGRKERRGAGHADRPERSDRGNELPAGRDGQREQVRGSITKTLAKELKVGKVGFNQYEGFKIRLTDEEKRWANSTYADTLFNGSGRDVIGLRAMMSGNRWETNERRRKDRSGSGTCRKRRKKQVLTELVRRKKEAGEIR